MQLREVIDKAARVSGSQAALGRPLGVTPQHITNWRNGHATPSPEDVALIAQVAGLDPQDALIRAVLAKHQGTPKGERLESALGKRLRATGAAVISAITGAVVALTLWALPPPAEASTCHNV